MRRRNKKSLGMARIMLNLKREGFEFVDKIGRDALFSTGRRLTNNKIIMTFIDVMKELDIDGEGLHDCNELKNRILMALGMKKERRLYPRFRKEIKVSWRNLDSMAEHEKGGTKDIGYAGFRIQLREKKNVGDVLEFTIHDPLMPDNPIKAFGRIVWVKGKEAGVKLTYLPEREKDRFNKLFYENMRKVLENIK